jgi:hypothetical protein
MSDLFLPVFYGTLASGVAIRVAEVLINEYTDVGKKKPGLRSRYLGI